MDPRHPRRLCCNCNRRLRSSGCRGWSLHSLGVDAFLPTALAPHYRRHLPPPLSFLLLTPCRCCCSGGSSSWPWLRSGVLRPTSSNSRLIWGCNGSAEGRWGRRELGAGANNGFSYSSKAKSKSFLSSRSIFSLLSPLLFSSNSINKKKRLNSFNIYYIIILLLY